MTNNSSGAADIPLSGYDLPIYGLEDGSFYRIHIIAIASLSVSLLCSVSLIAVSCSSNQCQGFFTGWRKGSRFVIYMAVCDIMHGLVQLADHVNVFVAKDHVYPKELCTFYAFVLLIAVMAENLLVNVIAINAFALLYIDRHLDFGMWDWKLQSWIFGVPLTCSVVSLALNSLGPNEAYCGFDSITGGDMLLSMLAVPFTIILVTNALLYVLIWAKLHSQTSAIKKILGRMSAAMRATHTAARSMTLFVVAYTIQWWAIVLYTFWEAVLPPAPSVLFPYVSLFTNIGGVLNLIVFTTIRRSPNNSGASSGVHLRNRPQEAGVQNPVFSVSSRDALPAD